MPPHSLNQVIETCPKGKRDELTTLVADQLAAGSQNLQKDEIRTLNNVLEESLDGLSTGTKEHISTTVAASPATSAGLALKLARDEASVAIPVLEQSPVLSPEDLKAVIREKGQQHLGAIAKREVLARDVTELLLSEGDDTVLRTIVQNLGADIPQDEFERLIKTIPQKMGRRISHLRKSNEKVIEDLLRGELEHVVGAELAPREASITAEDWLDTLKAGRADINRALAQLCIEKNLQGIATLLADLSGLHPDYAAHLMVRIDATGLSVVCKSLGINTLEYATLSRVRCIHLRLPLSIGYVWSANYSILETLDAKRLLGLLSLKLQQAAPGTD